MSFFREMKINALDCPRCLEPNVGPEHCPDEHTPESDPDPSRRPPPGRDHCADTPPPKEP